MCEHGEVRGARFCAICRKSGNTLKMEAMETVQEHANGLWWAAAHRAIKDIATRQMTITADEVLALIESWGYKTNDNRALGPVMNSAKAKGWIKATSTFEPSSNKRKHQSPTRVWESCIMPSEMQLW